MYTVHVYLDTDSVPNQIVEAETATDAVVLGRVLVNQAFRAMPNVTCDVVGPDQMLIACIDKTNNETKAIVDNRKWLSPEGVPGDRYPTLMANRILEQ